MNQIWDEAKVQQYIDDEIEESLMLDYKAAGALEKSDKKKGEITKDVSAMANSAGGIIIYGIKEYQDDSKKHLPEKIDPISRKDFSKEWLEHVIGNIQPRLSNVIIHPVPIQSRENHVVYVVEIPQSILPHQALDRRYYKRYNFESTWMDDYEINDVRNRQSSVEKLLNFDVELKKTYIVYFNVENFGSMPALDVKFEFSPNLKWRQKETPLLFTRGAKVIPPQKTYSYFYESYDEIINNEDIPAQFDLEISYLHPQINQRISDVFHIDLLDYMYTSEIKSDLQEHTETLKKAINDLKRELDKLNKNLASFPAITNATGLDLSMTTLRNLRNLLQNHQFEKLDPSYCTRDVFQEILGIDYQLSHQIWHYFRWPKEGQKLEDIQGMDEKLIEEFYRYFSV